MPLHSQTQFVSEEEFAFATSNIKVNPTTD